MLNKEITLKITLNMDEEWVNNQGRDEAIEYVKDKLNSILSFRGHIKKLRVARRRKV